MNWIDRHRWVWALIGALVSSIVFAFSTFATIDYVDKKHLDVARWLERIEAKLDRALE